VSQYNLSLLISIYKHHSALIQLDIHRLKLVPYRNPNLCFFMISVLSHDRDTVTSFASVGVFGLLWW